MASVAYLGSTWKASLEALFQKLSKHSSARSRKKHATEAVLFYCGGISGIFEAGRSFTRLTDSFVYAHLHQQALALLKLNMAKEV